MNDERLAQLLPLLDAAGKILDPLLTLHQQAPPRTTEAQVTTLVALIRALAASLGPTRWAELVDGLEQCEGIDLEAVLRGYEGSEGMLGALALLQRYFRMHEDPVKGPLLRAEIQGSPLAPSARRAGEQGQ